jgi:hypothetical protein
MKTIATFLDVHEAYVIKGVLEAEDIPAVVVDENAAAYTPIIGGVRLQVSDDDYGRAMAVLGNGQPNPDTHPEEEPPVEVCPACGSGQITVNPLAQKTITGFLASLFAGRKERVCGKCGEKW